LLLALLATVPFVLLLPRHISVSTHHDHADGSGRNSDATRRILLLAAITFAIGCASGIMWAFYALIGQQVGLSVAATDTAISTAIFASLCSAGLASILGNRFSRNGIRSAPGWLYSPFLWVF